MKTPPTLLIQSTPMMRSDENSSKTYNFSFPLFVFHQTVTSTFPIVSVKRSSAILRVDVVGLIGDFIGCTAECLTTLTETPESTIALTTPRWSADALGLRENLLPGLARFRPCRFPSSYPFLSMDSPTVDGLFYHIDNNSGAHLVELPIVEGVASALSHSFF